jgi:uncharacterized membrane protein required for colicin V production
MSYWIIFGIVLFATVAMTVREGLWSNTLTLVNIIISGLVAFGFYAPLVVYLDESVTDGQHTYWLDFAVLWALFCIAMVICRSLTAAFSKTRMRFKYPIDDFGGPLVGLIAAFVLASFTLASFHAAPMPKDFLGGKLAYTSADSASPISQPDATWLKFVASVSSPDALGASSTGRFSANGFVKIYGDRREKFQKAPSLIVKRGT